MNRRRGRTVVSDYIGPSWLIGAHAQTIFPAIIQSPAPIGFRRERVDTPDDDFWDFDWLDSDAPADAPLLILFHGLEGSSRSHYACAAMYAAKQRDWRGVVPHFRGCSGEINRQARAYHMGDYEEIAAMFAAIHARVPTDTPVFAVGVSLGGSAMLNWLGRAVPDLRAAAAISAPLDLPSCGKALDSIHGVIYARNFLSTLKPKSLTIAQNHPEKKLDLLRLQTARTLREFDDYFTAPMHGFADHADYWQRASARHWLAKITTPTLLLNALNDPLVPFASLPAATETSEAVFLERPAKGGHAGFPTAGGAKNAWMPKRLLSFFSEYL
ncbi:MAG: alpha/beta fold hydrolase [Burkholderiales bacterium]|jgi:predicted alpha/beta-fold hydrolase|nr:alpha/beta fold hydrolase [Burkholderiales bacterium]